MIKYIIFICLSLVYINGKYLDSKSCAECHDTIYAEHMNSMHSHSSLFKDEFHRKMKELNFPNSYRCAVCHIPGADHLDKIISGEIQPTQTKKQLDGVSCLYCHQIAHIKKAHKQNINITTFGRDGIQLLYGALNNPDKSNKHDSITIDKRFNIFANSKVCMGCHSHKRNDSHDVEICKISMDESKQTDCIGCHMPKYAGGNTKINRRSRLQYVSHDFLGISDTEMVKKAVKLSLKQISSNTIELTIENKMGHQILLQPMRLKYVKTTISRDGNIIWQNFKNSPYEDKEVTFSKLFVDKNGTQVYPPKAYGIKYYTNLDTYKSKSVIYKVPTLKKGDIVTSTWYSYMVRPSLAKKLNLTDYKYKQKLTGDVTELVIP